MPSQPDLHTAMARKNARLGLTILGVVLGMAGLAYASVPLYDMFCRVTGFGGTTQTSDIWPEQIIDRSLTINFNADISPNLPWDFSPEQRSIDVKLGQKGLAAFHAKNKAATPIAGSALYNVTPLKAGKYFHKVQCFCFDEQILQPGENVSMPVLFYVDPKMNDDPNMDDVQTITLSYTFFTSESEELEQAIEDFYNQ
ncbi:MAG: cytochrome c oxidase assembly protein [Rhodospirillales bacterium]|nr:cytochrome c oxidase assembly protein [Alphaproteobacteria bacterium]MCB9981972.1 cytochrome c oxidase assembly protein [Rhodospirillales bacterium]